MCYFLRVSLLKTSLFGLKERVLMQFFFQGVRFYSGVYWFNCFNFGVIVSCVCVFLPVLFDVF